MAISINVSFSGSPDNFDVEAAQLLVEQVNAERADQELEPLPLTPIGDLAASYRTVLQDRMEAIHSINKKRAAAQALEEDNVKTLWEQASPAQRTAAVTALGG